MRLIDADSIPWDVDGVGEIPVITKEEIDSMPTVDAVPVIRCKDCHYWNGYKIDVDGRQMRACEILWMNQMDDCATDPDHYCGWAERKDNG